MIAAQVFGARSLFALQIEMLGLEFRQNSLSIELRREQYDEKLRTESPVDRSDERPLASWGKAQSLMLD